MIDIDFQFESFQWVKEMRGGRFMRQARKSIERIGPTKTAERIVRLNMPEEMEQVYRAAINYMDTLAPQSG